MIWGLEVRNIPPISQSGVVTRDSRVRHQALLASGTHFYVVVCVFFSSDLLLLPRYLLAPSVSEKFNITWAGQTMGGQLVADGILKGNVVTETVTCSGGNLYFILNTVLQYSEIHQYFPLIRVMPRDRPRSWFRLSLLDPRSSHGCNATSRRFHLHFPDHHW
jgi:uncharacterized membrane protein